MLNLKRLVRFFIPFIAILLVVGAFFAIVPAQSQPSTTETCPALVEQALESLEMNCTGMGRNTACYGNNRVSATFTQEVEDEFFSRPADRAEVVMLQGIVTAPLDELLQEWGIALMNVQANLPGTLPGQGVTFVLLGDATVVNAVPPEEAQLPTPPVSATTATETPLRTGPGANRNLVTRVPAGSAVEVDALSADRQWVRAVFGEFGGWMLARALSPVDLSSLPVITEETRSPMQAFLFRTGLGAPRCAQAPNSVVVQGPVNTEITLNVNGAEINVGSTVMFTSVEGAPLDIIEGLNLPPEIVAKLQGADDDDGTLDQQCALMRMTVVNGSVTLNDGKITLPEGNAAWAVYCAEEGQTVEEVFNAIGQRDETGQRFFAIDLEQTGFTYSPWGAFRTLTPEELDALRILENIPQDVINYQIDIPDFGSILGWATSTPTPTNTSQPIFLPTNTPFPTVTPTSTPETIVIPPAPTATPTVSALTINPAANNQTATVGQPFPVPFQVTATGGSGPVAGVPVTFSAPASGASGTFAATGTNTQTVLTDSNGVATASPFTSNTIAGTYNVVAAAGTTTALTLKPEDYAKLPSGWRQAGGSVLAAFTVTNAPGAPTAVEIAGGDLQGGVVGEPYGLPLQARVVDTYGNGVPGQSVTFTAPDEGASGTFNESLSAEAVTDAAGVATSPTFTANSVPGPVSVQASASVGSVTFSLYNTPGDPAFVIAEDGVEQSTEVGTAFPTQMSVRVLDSFENPVPGASVTFTAPSSGASGTFEGGGAVAVVTTNNDGLAVAPVFTANTTAGSYVVTATSGSGSADFFLYNYPGAPAEIQATGGTPQSTTVGTDFPTLLQARLVDQYGNGVSGVNVTFEAPFTLIPQGGPHVQTMGSASGYFGESNFATAFTDGDGYATAPTLTANTYAGSFEVMAYPVGYEVSSAIFQLTNTPDAPYAVYTWSGSYQSTEVNTAFGSPLEVLVTDQYGNAIPNVVVTFTAPTSGASAVFPNGSTATTDTNGLASVDVQANDTAGSYTVTASADGVSVTAEFYLENLPPPESTPDMGA